MNLVMIIIFFRTFVSALIQIFGLAREIPLNPLAYKNQDRIREQRAI